MIDTSFSRSPFLWTAMFVVLAAGRILSTYGITSQAFDEPCHVAAGIELLSRGTYTLDPVHPPLARWAIGIPLYLAGVRYPQTGPAAVSDNYNVVGNSILYDSGHHTRDLALARLSVLPFFFFAACVVFLWACHEFGDFAAVMAVGLFTTLPIVLAFSGIAYTDMIAASTQAAFLFVFVIWLQRRTTRTTILLGIAAGLALSAKFTSLIFLPAAAGGILITKWILAHNGGPPPRLTATARQSAIAGLIAVALLWGGYRFAYGHVQESMQLSVASMPSFQNFPAPIRGMARKLVLSDPMVPAPALIKGLATVWVLNHQAPNSYLFGKIKRGGWWYFFLAGIAVKSPLPFLLLTMVGFIALWPLARSRQWTALAPAVSAAAILVVTMPVKYNAGVRHVMVVFPLLSIMAGQGCSFLWRMRQPWHRVGKIVLLGLLTWQVVSTYRARQDFIAYFNELGGRDPSRILVMGCDLDCGQDVIRLSKELRAEKAPQVTLALWTSADMSRSDLPPFAVAQPGKPVSGWLAVSVRALRVGHVFHDQYPENAFEWLNQYTPVKHVGKTILLYHLP